MMTDVEMAAVRNALRNILAAAAKADDAPMSAATHLDSAIVLLASICLWRPTDSESIDVLNDAIEHMKYYRKAEK